MNDGRTDEQLKSQSRDISRSAKAIEQNDRGRPVFGRGAK